MKNISGKRILILGGAGMVGTAVARALLASGPARIAIAATARVNMVLIRFFVFIVFSRLKQTISNSYIIRQPV